MRTISQLLAVLFTGVAAWGQQADLWEHLGRVPDNLPATAIWIRAEKSHAFKVRPAALRAHLQHARHESPHELLQPDLEIALPMPGGATARFRIVEAPVMAPELAAKFPEIKTYRGVGVDDPQATLRLDVTPAGMHAQILSPRGAVYIDPYLRGNNELHTSYYKRDYRRAVAWVCEAGSSDALGRPALAAAEALSSGGTLRVYRLACAADYEYTTFHGGTVSAGLAAVVTAINRVTGVYEVELAIRMVLVANNDQLIFTTKNDGYTDNSGSSMLGQNQKKCDNIIGDANYDIGHVFSTGGGGIAYLGVVCVSGSKAGGVTGNSSPVGDSFWIDYVAHEMGHQFGGNHTFNSSTLNCGGGNRNASTAYEVGSGSTIMAYAGICGADNLQPHSDPYFHLISYDEIMAYVAGSGNCSSNSATGNNPPTVNVGANYTIPQNTPFVLTATGSDPDGDPLTFCWEEWDLGASITLTTPDNGSSPLFRSFNPTNSPARMFPKLADVLGNTNSLGEMLPTTNRTLKFRVTARDNRANGGGVCTSGTNSITVTTAAGPFRVTAPNTAVTWAGTQTVTWNVAGTTNSPVNAANVNILLSTNGGTSFTTMLVSNTPNNGAATVVLPNISNTTARIKVEATGNIFFDISDTNFTITNYAAEPPPVITGQPVAQNVCAGDTAMFAVTATGNNLAYQWQKDSTNLNGAVTNPLTIFPVGAGDAGSYRCVVGNPGGSVTSSVAGLTVSFPVLAANPDGLNFSTLVTGATAQVSFNVTNTGCGTLTGSAASQSAPFAVVAGSSFSVGAGQSTNITVEFAPVIAGSFTTTVVFTSNGGDSTNRVTGNAITVFQDWQLQKFGCIDCPQAAPDVDPDGDGFTNLQEYLAGTDPTTPASALRFTALEWLGTDLRLWWDAVGGKSYAVEATPFLGGSYSNISGVIFVPTTGPTNYLDSSAGTNSLRFYRLKLE